MSCYKRFHQQRGRAMTWRHENAFHITDLLSGESSGFPAQTQVMSSFDISFMVSLNKLLNKQPSCQWSEMAWHCDGETLLFWSWYPKLMKQPQYIVLWNIVWFLCCSANTEALSNWVICLKKECYFLCKSLFEVTLNLILLVYNQYWVSILYGCF